MFIGAIGLAKKGALITDHSDEPADEPKVHEVVWVDGGGGVDLQAVVAVVGVLKEAVHGVEHLVGEVEEPLPAQTTQGSTLRTVLQPGASKRCAWASNFKKIKNIYI